MLDGVEASLMELRPCCSCLFDNLNAHDIFKEVTELKLAEVLNVVTGIDACLMSPIYIEVHNLRPHHC